MDPSPRACPRRDPGLGRVTPYYSNVRGEARFWVTPVTGESPSRRSSQRGTTTQRKSGGCETTVEAKPVLNVFVC